jgi:hypothetical protein
MARDGAGQDEVRQVRVTGQDRAVEVRADAQAGQAPGAGQGDRPFAAVLASIAVARQDPTKRLGAWAQERSPTVILEAHNGLLLPAEPCTRRRVPTDGDDRGVRLEVDGDVAHDSIRSWGRVSPDIQEAGPDEVPDMHGTVAVSDVLVAPTDRHQ